MRVKIYRFLLYVSTLGTYAAFLILSAYLTTKIPSKRRTVQTITVLWLCLSLGCSQAAYQGKRVTTENEGLQEPVQGAYTTIKTTSCDSSLIGELIFVDDSIYLLTGNGLVVTYPINEIVTLNAQLTRFSERSFFMLAAIVIPSLLGLLAKSKEVNTFGTVGLIAAGPGLLVSIFETSKKPHFICYPAAPIEEFRKYARFPESLPQDFGEPSMAKFNNYNSVIYE